MDKPMTDLRDKIADIVASEYWAHDPLITADAIIAALPDMVPELVWSNCEAETEFGSIYKIDSGWSDKIGGKRWYAWAFNPPTNDDFYIWQHGERAETEDAAIAAVNAHHRATLMAALGIETKVSQAPT